MRPILSLTNGLVLSGLVLGPPAWAAGTYPVSGRWGESSNSAKGAIDCNGRRVIGFNGQQRTDSRGGVPAYRNVTVTPSGGGYRVVDEFSNGQVRGGRTSFTLRQVDDDHIEMTPQGGGTLKLQRCK
jgi:hypothetical protein